MTVEVEQVLGDVDPRLRADPGSVGAQGQRKFQRGVRRATPDLAPPPVTGLLRVRWVYLVLGVTLGALLGVLAGGSTGAPQFSASSVLQVGATTPDSNRVAQLAQSTQLLGRSAPVLREAAESTGTTVADLQARAQVLWRDPRDIIEVTVVADQPAAAVRDANALMDAIVSVSAARAQGRLALLRAEGDKVLENDVLRDPDAEKARKGALGSALAARQDEAIYSAGTVAVLERAVEASPGGPSYVVAGALGALGGLGLAAGAAIALGGRRRKITGPQELALLAPDLANRSPFVAEEQAGRLLDKGAAGLVVLAMPGAEPAALELGARVVETVLAHDLEASLVDAVDGLNSDELRALRFGAGTPGVTRVVVCRADERSVGLLASGTRFLSLIVAAPGQSRLCDVRLVATTIASTEPTVVVRP